MNGWKFVKCMDIRLLKSSKMNFNQLKITNYVGLQKQFNTYRVLTCKQSTPSVIIYLSNHQRLSNKDHKAMVIHAEQNGDHGMS